jgi:hypothetical protein
MLYYIVSGQRGRYIDDHKMSYWYAFKVGIEVLSLEILQIRDNVSQVFTFTILG